MTTDDDAPNEPIAKMMAVEMQRTNPIANSTADENSPNEPTVQDGVYEESDLSASKE